MGKIAELLEKEFFNIDCNSCYYLIQLEYKQGKSLRA